MGFLSFLVGVVVGGLVMYLWRDEILEVIGWFFPGSKE